MITNPLERAVAMFNGLSKSNIFNWFQQSEKLQAAITHGTSGVQKQSNRAGCIISFKSTAARRMTLHPGRGTVYAAAEEELYSMFRDERKKGKRIQERWFTVQMRKIIREIYGDEPADRFKGSHGWLTRFGQRFQISLRRATNNKNEPVELRLPKIKRWHARLCRRLKTGASHRQHPIWGRWLPENRLSVDQVRSHVTPLTHTYCM